MPSRNPLQLPSRKEGTRTGMVFPRVPMRCSRDEKPAKPLHNPRYGRLTAGACCIANGVDPERFRVTVNPVAALNMAPASRPSTPYRRDNLGFPKGLGEEDVPRGHSACGRGVMSRQEDDFNGRPPLADNRSELHAIDLRGHFDIAQYDTGVRMIFFDLAHAGRPRRDPVYGRKGPLSVLWSRTSSADD